MFAAVSTLRFLFAPFCAAIAAALFAHIGIDVLGDYALPHDSYDDLAHGSRVLLIGAGACLFAASFACAFAAAIREARGCVDAFGRILRSSIALPWAAFLAATFVAAITILAGMEIADAATAGRVVDGIADIFGGSLALGLATLCFSTFVCAFGTRLAIRALAGLGRSLVRALASVFAMRERRCDPTSSAAFARTRFHATSVLAATFRSGRAPPASILRRPLSFF